MKIVKKLTDWPKTQPEGRYVKLVSNFAVAMCKNPSMISFDLIYKVCVFLINAKISTA